MTDPATTPEPPAAARIAEVAQVFLRLGVTSFGGPVAHLGYFRKECVERRHWVDDAAYADIMALCQFLPGPTSSQAAFILGMRRAGLAGAVAASACFTAPSAAVMIALAYGLSHLSGLAGLGLLHGLRLAAVPVVAQAIWGMSVRLCPDGRRRIMAAAAAAAAVALPGFAGQAGAVAACAAAAFAFRSRAPAPPAPVPAFGSGHRWAVACLVLFLLLLLMPALSLGRLGEVAGAFYRCGALVFGGGHVVLPLLRSEVVGRGWLGDDAFLAGYGAAQALPGPLFTFGAYLGTLIVGGPLAWAGGLAAMAALFLPGWLSVAGAYPFWRALRARAWARTALSGANAAVVGLLAAALYRPLGLEAVRSWADLAAAAAGFCALVWGRLPSWALVALMAAAGQWILR